MLLRRSSGSSPPAWPVPSEKIRMFLPAIAHLYCRLRHLRQAGHGPGKSRLPFYPLCRVGTGIHTSCSNLPSPATLPSSPDLFRGSTSSWRLRRGWPGRALRREHSCSHFVLGNYPKGYIVPRAALRGARSRGVAVWGQAGLRGMASQAMPAGGPGCGPVAGMVPGPRRADGPRLKAVTGPASPVRVQAAPRGTCSSIPHHTSSRAAIRATLD